MRQAEQQIIQKHLEEIVRLQEENGSLRFELAVAKDMLEEAKANKVCLFP